MTGRGEIMEREEEGEEMENSVRIEPKIFSLSIKYYLLEIF